MVKVGWWCHSICTMPWHGADRVVAWCRSGVFRYQELFKVLGLLGRKKKQIEYDTKEISL